jgi:hypothetical protein
MSIPVSCAIRMNWGAQDGLTLRLYCILFENEEVIIFSYISGVMSSILAPLPVGTKKNK